MTIGGAGSDLKFSDSNSASDVMDVGKEFSQPKFEDNTMDFSSELQAIEAVLHGNVQASAVVGDCSVNNAMPGETFMNVGSPYHGIYGGPFGGDNDMVMAENTAWTWLESLVQMEDIRIASMQISGIEAAACTQGVWDFAKMADPTPKVVMGERTIIECDVIVHEQGDGLCMNSARAPSYKNTHCTQGACQNSSYHFWCHFRCLEAMKGIVWPWLGIVRLLLLSQ